MRICIVCLLVSCLSFVTVTPQVRGDEDLTVVVNPRIGTASLRNDTQQSISIDGYLFVGDDGETVTFNPGPGGWSSLTEASTPGWLEGQATTTVLSEVNLSQSLTIAGQSSVSIGLPYEVFTPGTIGEAEPSFVFTYSETGVGVLPGDVEFEVDNDVVLVVDPITGDAILQNQSIFDVNIDSYVIQSAPGVLDPGSWVTLQTSQGSGWIAAPGNSSFLSEGRLLGSSLLVANGESLPIGSPIAPALLDDESDLIFQYSTAAVDGSPAELGLVGGVLFRSLAVGLPGDFNNDGTVNLADYGVWRDNLGAATDAALNGNGDGVDGVDQDDYDLWKSRFGSVASALTAGGPLSASTSSVPEPATWLLAVAGAIAGLRCRHGRATST